MRFALAILLFPFAVHAVDLHGRIVGIADGDTVTLLDASNQQHKIRLSGIDAPEKAQPFGQKSKANLAALVFGKIVVGSCEKRDRYGREVCKIIVDGQDVNLAQIDAGMAWWYRGYAKEQSADDRRIYEASEDEAKSRRRGLWSDSEPAAPWEWRRRTRP